jgi:F-type H+-transporting ATPase subunit b
MHSELFPLLTAAVETAPAASAGGLEAIQQVLGPFGVKPLFLAAQIVNFGVVAAVVYYFAIRPVIATTEARKTEIASGLKYAEEMKHKLAETQKQQEEILKQASLEGKKVIAEARDTGKALVEKATQDATRTAEDIIKKGQSAVALERQQMLNELRREVAQLVVATSQRVLGRDLTADERARFNTSAASDLSKN